MGGHTTELKSVSPLLSNEHLPTDPQKSQVRGKVGCHTLVRTKTSDALHAHPLPQARGPIVPAPLHDIPWDMVEVIEGSHLEQSPQPITCARHIESTVTATQQH